MTTQLVITKVDGFTVEMVDTDNGANCYISKGYYNASLACLQDTGELENENGRAIKVHPQTLAEIERWAEENGY